MKRLAAAAVASAIALMTAVSAFAASVTVSGDTDTAPITYTYSSESQVTNTESIKELLTSLKNFDGGSVTQSLTVSSQSENPVKFWLRLAVKAKETSDELPKAEVKEPDPDSESVLDYYNIIITAESGDEIYSSKNDEKSSPNDTYKDIELLTLNTDKTQDSQSYNIEISKAGSDELASDAAELDWQIVSDGYSGAFEATAEPADTQVPSEKNTDVKEVTLAPGTYEIGSDIAAGKYTASGSSTVKVYTEEGELKTNIVLTTDKNSKTGVLECVLKLAEGEKLEVTGETKLVPYSAAAAASASPKASAAPSSNPKSSKSNPKTGDIISLTAAAGIGGVSLAAAVFAEIKKRRKNDN